MNTVYLHFSKKNHEAWGGKGTRVIKIGDTTVRFNHWGTNMEGNVKPESVFNTMQKCAPQNPESYALVGQLPADEFLEKTDRKLAL